MDTGHLHIQQDCLIIYTKPHTSQKPLQIGFLLFLPFLVIDMVIASILMSLGMMMLSPMLVALPFKLLLFVLVDGWAMTVGSLVATYSVS